ncbi:MAG TPA: SRPBCC domain-containing protein [Gemmatimonadaceae bacterium]|nr:SRPBCC domain-containing protein [Gemmatimonadaceae bacterium]
MPNDLIAKASTTVNASVDEVWSALTTPSTIKRYMFGTTVTSDWKEGSPITWKGEWEGRAYEDKGVIKQFRPSRLLQYTHYSPLSGVPDKPENYHTVTIELLGRDGSTDVTLTQDNNATEEARAHSQRNWEMMLGSLKKVVEE